MPDPVRLIRIRLSPAFGWSPLVAILATCALLFPGSQPGRCDETGVQGSPLSMERQPGMGATSPLGSESGPAVPSAGIPMGSTEIATPGISPAPLPGVGFGTANANCPGFDARSNTPSVTFDGGGLPGGPPSPCISASDANASSVAPPALPTQRAGIPLGSTELANPGVATAAPVPLANPQPTGSPALSGAVPCPATAASPTSGPAPGC